MKLLLDQNISRHVAAAFAGIEIHHVSHFNLETATDRQIWDFARDNDYALVSKDADFHHMSFMFGAPPKTIWLKLGNCSTRQVAACISRNLQTIAAFLGEEDSALMVITQDSVETGVDR